MPVEKYSKIIETRAKKPRSVAQIESFKKAQAKLKEVRALKKNKKVEEVIENKVNSSEGETSRERDNSNRVSMAVGEDIRGGRDDEKKERERKEREEREEREKRKRERDEKRDLVTPTWFKNYVRFTQEEKRSKQAEKKEKIICEPKLTNEPKLNIITEKNPYEGIFPNRK